jgi:hypothetical protein
MTSGLPWRGMSLKVIMSTIDWTKNSVRQFFPRGQVQYGFKIGDLMISKTRTYAKHGQGFPLNEFLKAPAFA